MEDDRGPSFPARSLGGSVFGASQSIPWLNNVSLHDIETRADCIYTVSNSLVNPQTPEVVTNLVEDYLYKEFEKLHSRNTIKVIPGFGGLPWVGDINHWNFQAAYEATKVRRRHMFLCRCRIYWEHHLDLKYNSYRAFMETGSHHTIRSREALSHWCLHFRTNSKASQTCCCCLWADPTTVLSKLHITQSCLGGHMLMIFALCQFLEREGGHLELYRWGKLGRSFQRG